MQTPTKERSVLSLSDGRLFTERVSFADEAPLSLAVGGRVVTVLMATPGGERELAAGYALTMGWAKPGDLPPRVDFQPGSGRVDLDLVISSDQVGQVRAAGGGLLGPPEADPLPPGGELDAGVLGDLTGTMTRAQTLYGPTRGTHAAVVFSAQGETLALAEDVGRHNGLDKAVGGAWLAGLLPRAAALALSGRCSLEMVMKSVRSGVRVVVSVSAPTLPAVEAAERLGLTLVNCSDPRVMRIYTHPGRITLDGKPLSA